MTHDPDQLAKRILNRIDEEHVVPRPRWEFTAKNYLFWTLGGAAVLLGALAFSAALFVLLNADWRFAEATHADVVAFALAVAPYLWLAALLLFIGLGYANIRHTRRGYRYPLVVLAFGAVLASVLMGSALYAAGLGGDVEEALGDHPPFYRPILTTQKQWWSAPEKGLIGGEVLEIATGTGVFVLKDFTGKEWRVDASELPPTDQETLAAGMQVRIIGVSATSSAVHACFVFPWKAEKGKQAKVKNRAPNAETEADGEISSADRRTELCKGIRPYAQLRRLESGL